MTIAFEVSDRIKQLPPYLFVEIDRLKNEIIAKGKDVIDLGIGDPDIPTPSVIIKALQKAVENPQHHRYPSTSGMLSFRTAVANWAKNRFGISLDPATEVVSLIGSKEGIANMPLAYINPGDYVLVPNPGYPPYTSGTLFAGGIPYLMPLLAQNKFLPDLNAIPADIANKAKIMFLNYPNNPTAALATPEFFADVVAFAKKYNIIVCHDAAYSEVCFDGYKAPSFLETPGAREVGIEFHSLSKTFCMTGWRIGFAFGNPQIVAALAKVKSNIDSGAFQAIQEAGITALTEGLAPAKNIYNVFERRRTMFVKGLKDIGLECDMVKATFYIWIKNPGKFSSAELAKRLLEEAALVLTPGNGFGKYGEGYIRAALTVPEPRLQEAIDRIKSVL
ncbi:MAG: LL-diaminopimelate aminotransferase [Candidatus Auribacter fodinae]|jgi:LL-diaminopimelate aminotransferase|uniref:LL-diaminopimelate aminotransferase n=1 Tax=Candidatus Auribacter fodinae TaxID=2093366 RepID=A0A3A4RH57_9BACT|nr:MAG: LL-diaminopimelate aminotransferase [Candidatus Auribacter fodinae]